MRFGSAAGDVDGGVGRWVVWIVDYVRKPVKCPLRAKVRKIEPWRLLIFPLIIGDSEIDSRSYRGGVTKRRIFDVETGQHRVGAITRHLWRVGGSVNLR